MSDPPAGKLSKGNPKTGRSVITFGRTPFTTCPGASEMCSSVDRRDGDMDTDTQDYLETPTGKIPTRILHRCYAARPYNQYDQTRTAWDRNAMGSIPALPAPKRNGKVTPFRIHTSGDFDTAQYTMEWYYALKPRQDIRAWSYTKSWRVPELMPYLEKLRTLENVQLFATVDHSIPERPPTDWRISAIAGDPRYSGADFPICMEQTKQQPDCKTCRYCWVGKRGNIAFIWH